MLAVEHTRSVVAALGPAGTGKTYLAIAKAVEALEQNRVGRIVLSRPAVEAGESLGFLPGDLQDKLAPYLGRTFPLVQGGLGGEIKLQGSIASSLHVGGNLSLADAALREGIISEAATALPTLTSTQDITVDLPAARSELTDVEINVAGIQVTIKGVVHTFTTTPQLDLQVATNTFTPTALLTQLPMLASMVPTSTDVRGNVQLQATVKGAPHDLRAEAQIDLQEIVLKSGSFSGGPPPPVQQMLLAGDLDRRSVSGSQVFPIFPLLAQGWALLDAHDIAIPSRRALQGTLLPSVWTLFNADGVLALRQLMTSGGIW